jgi:FdhD protein
VTRVRDSGAKVVDEVVVEEPMELRVFTLREDRWVRSPVAITMRTPGHDFELAAGFLYAEGVISSRDDIINISYCTDPLEPQQYNVVNVYLAPDVEFDPQRLSRATYTTSSCGVCGKASIEQLKQLGARPVEGAVTISAHQVEGMVRELTEAQALYARTGGLHASALFDYEGSLQLIREDVGRHNAMDKLVGALLLRDRLPAEGVVVISGRASFELVQKTLLAGIPLLLAVGAPTSLAVQLAEEYGLTLVGFAREGSFNIYTHPERITV